MTRILILVGLVALGDCCIAEVLIAVEDGPGFSNVNICFDRESIEGKDIYWTFKAQKKNDDLVFAVEIDPKTWGNFYRVTIALAKSSELEFYLEMMGADWSQSLIFSKIDLQLAQRSDNDCSKGVEVRQTAIRKSQYGRM